MTCLHCISIKAAVTLHFVQSVFPCSLKNDGNAVCHDEQDGQHAHFVARLTDPIPTTETSITPRQRPKAVHTQPAAGILPIQPAALTPRKRANLPGGAAQPVGEYSDPPLFSYSSQGRETELLNKDAQKDRNPSNPLCMHWIL